MLPDGCQARLIFPVLNVHTGHHRIRILRGDLLLMEGLQAGRGQLIHLGTQGPRALFWRYGVSTAGDEAHTEDHDEISHLCLS